jgi:hypothetical protein
MLNLQEQRKEDKKYRYKINSMEECPSWEADIRSDIKEISHRLWNNKIPLSATSVYIPTTYFSKIHFNVILPSTPMSSG